MVIRGVREGAASAVSFGIVLAALVAIDPRVSDKVWNVMEHPSGEAIAPFSDRIGELANVIWMAARDQSVDNAPLLFFTVVAVVLVVFMLRS
jgi:hypothetical protein